MKTQIKNLRIGAMRQVLNAKIDYTSEQQTISSGGHSGTSDFKVSAVWAKVVGENPKALKLKVKGVLVDLVKRVSISGKTIVYYGDIEKSDLKIFGLVESKKHDPYISFFTANHIEISNGGNSYVAVCPSLVDVL